MHYFVEYYRNTLLIKKVVLNVLAIIIGSSMLNVKMVMTERFDRIQKGSTAHKLGDKQWSKNLQADWDMHEGEPTALQWINQPRVMVQLRSKTETAYTQPVCARE